MNSFFSLTMTTYVEVYAVARAAALKGFDDARTLSLEGVMFLWFVFMTASFAKRNVFYLATNFFRLTMQVTLTLFAAVMTVLVGMFINAQHPELVAKVRELLASLPPVTSG